MQINNLVANNEIVNARSSNFELNLISYNTHLFNMLGYDKYEI